MGSIEQEEEREFIKSLVDKLFDPTISVVEKVQYSVQIQVRVKNIENDVVLPQQRSEIYPPNPQKVVTDL